jgi:hypothetical protein
MPDEELMKTLVAATLLSAAFLPAQALADSPFDGTWKVDLSSGGMPREPVTFLIKDGMFTCRTCGPGYTIRADGTDQRVRGHRDYNTVAIKLVDDHTVQETDKMNRRTVTTSTMTVAPDGKSARFEFKAGSNTRSGPVTGKGTERLVAEGPAGSHAASGSWMVTSMHSFAENGITVTYRTEGDKLTMTTGTGQSYTARTNGTEAPFKGDRGITSVSVRIDKRTLIESDMRNGRVIGTFRGTLNESGDTISVSYHDYLRGRTTGWTEKKM